MGSQRRQRKTRDRFSGGLAVVIRCTCGKRLADHFVSDAWRRGSPGVDGVRFVPWEDAARLDGGTKDLIHEDWWRVKCPRCGRDWRGRERDLVALIRDAEVCSARSVSLERLQPVS